MFDVKVYEGKSLSEGATLALKHRLYVSGWCLSGELRYLRDNEHTDAEIAIGFLDGEPVSVIMRQYSKVQAFCRKAVRKKGYSTKCLQALRSKPTFAEEGTDGSCVFWNKNGINARPWRY